MSQASQGSSLGRPRFSVVVPAYNAQDTLDETLEAMVAQELPDWECIIVDDGSTDRTPSIARAYCTSDKRFRLLQQPNSGAAGAYRTGLSAAVADLLVICAADDFLLPGHLAAMDGFIRENPDNEIYSSNGEYLYHESDTRRIVYRGPEWQVERSLSFEQVIAGCFYSVGAVFRPQVLETTGGHRIGVYNDDYDLWLRAMLRGARHRYVPRVLSVHRVSDFQQSANLKRVLESNIEVYQNLLLDASVQPAARAAIQRSIAENQERIPDVSAAQALERQSRALQLIVDRVVGAQRAESVMRAIHRISWVAGPVRRSWARMRSG